MHIFHNTNFDFLRWRWHAIVLSWVVIIAGVVFGMTRGVPLGLEFAGGTAVIAQFDKTPSIENVRQALDKNYPSGGENVLVQAYGESTSRQVMIRVPQVGASQGTLAEHHARCGREGAARRQSRQLQDRWHRDRQPDGRPRPDAEGHFSLRAVADRHPRLHRVPL
jgi:preprotein translocase subunit SecF